MPNGDHVSTKRKPDGGCLWVLIALLLVAGSLGVAFYLGFSPWLGN